MRRTATRFSRGAAVALCLSWWLAACGNGHAVRIEAMDTIDTVGIDTDIYLETETERLAGNPPMGWNSWNRFACDIDENLVRQMANALVDSGLADLGYRYVNLDDCWQVGRDEDGKIQADPARFPGGIKALADYVHQQGLKFGVYTCVGTKTCQERPGSFGYEELDARTYAEWGVDYVKADWCFTTGMDPRERYQTFGDAIKAAGRPMLHSLCNWGIGDTWLWGAKHGQLWRTTLDIVDTFPSMLFNFIGTEKLAAYAGPGRWNDPDMLEVGNGGMSTAEYQTHMSLWAMLAAPLILGNDLRNMDAATKAILTNRKVIDIDQDAMGLQAVRLSGEAMYGVWARPLTATGARAVLLFNGTLVKKELAFTLDELALATERERYEELTIEDVWSTEPAAPCPETYTETVAPRTARLFVVRGQELQPPKGQSFLSALPWKYLAHSGAAPTRLPATNSILAPATSKMVVYTAGRCPTLSATLGLDQSAGSKASVEISVYGDLTKIYQSEVLTTPGKTLDISLNVRRFSDLVIWVESAGDSEQDDLALLTNAKLECW